MVVMNFKVGKYLVNGKSYHKSMKELAIQLKSESKNEIDLYIVFSRELTATFGKVTAEEVCRILDENIIIIDEIVKEGGKNVKRHLITEWIIMDNHLR